MNALASLPCLKRRAVLRLGAGTLAAAACPAIMGQGSGTTIVRCPRADNEFDQLSIDMLRLALSHMPGNYLVQTWPLRVERNRALHEVARGQYLDVAWAVTSREREAALLPVRIPLDRGLSGWRIALVRRADSQRFAGVGNLGELARFRAGQGYDWAETAVLRSNGLPVVTGNNTDSLPAMLAAGRFDYYPRPLGQAWTEAQRHGQLGLVVEPHLALHFPSAVYFFVTKTSTALATALEQGLRKAIDNGTFERLFLSQHGPYLQRTALAQRRVIKLDNPGLTPETPLASRELWYLPP